MTLPTYARAIQLRLCVPVQIGDPGAGLVARRWFVDGLRLVDGSGMLAAFRAQSVYPPTMEGSVNCTVEISLPEDEDEDEDEEVEDVPYSDASSVLLLDAVESMGLYSSLSLSTLRVLEVPELPVIRLALVGGSPQVDVISRPVSSSTGRVVDLFVVIDVPALVDDEAWQRSAEEFLFRLADSCDACYGEVSFGTGGWQLALEDALAMNGNEIVETVAMARRVLRSYSWITIVPAELCRAVGGVEFFRGTGAFVEVRPLTADGVWLKATPTWGDYGDAEALRVVHALAPLLPGGRARRHPWISRNPVAEVDARDIAPLWSEAPSSSQ